MNAHWHAAMTRRALLRALAAGTAAAAGGGLGRQASAQGAPPIEPDLVLTNGRFVDGSGFVGRRLTIRGGRILGLDRDAPNAPDTRVLDLGGRTVIPGFVDAHVHYTRAGVNPGHEARRIERAFSIPELQETIAARSAEVPEGGFITCIGGWNHTQFAEARRPTVAELDEASPRHPVYLSGTGGGTGALANTLARTFFAARGVAVDEATGVVASPAQAVAALQKVQTPEDRLRGTAELNAHAARLGLTTVVNSGNLADQELALRLWRENRLGIRMRPLFPADSPGEVEARIANNFSQAGRAVGDDIFRVAGFGERIGGTNTMSPQFEPTARIIARHGWLLQQHSITLEENDFHIAALRAIDRDHPIGDLRWSLIHLQRIDAPRLKALIDLGAGASAQTWTYLSAAGGPPFRTIVDSGIRAAVGTDSTNVAALDPWLTMFYMTTGRNLAGIVSNEGQQISRLEALRLYTEGAAWFSFDDRQVGSFSAGKYADLAVLSHDFLSVPEETLRRIDSVLTLVGGRVVHAAAPFASMVRA